MSRQWSAFTGTFAGFLSLDGALVYALALVGTKTVHELAHAFTAARYGCRVSSMGVAFMVVVPMLYCDVTDSWRLPDRRQRMAIDAAGIVAEAVLAVYASLAWVLLPEGSLRTGAFLVATASMVSSLLINLNPMMRFDGYLLMADALAVPNLQARAFALLRWRLREALFDLRAPKPDQFAPVKQRVVIAYAAAIVCYRAVVYAGIALLVYHATFKLLGIALFAVEVGWFLVAPVWKEIAMWWRLKQGIRATRRSRLTGGVAAAILAAAGVPVPQHRRRAGGARAGRLRPRVPDDAGDGAIRQRASRRRSSRRARRSSRWCLRRTSATARWRASGSRSSRPSCSAAPASPRTAPRRSRSTRSASSCSTASTAWSASGASSC